MDLPEQPLNKTNASARGFLAAAQQFDQMSGGGFQMGESTEMMGKAVAQKPPPIPKDNGFPTLTAYAAQPEEKTPKDKIKGERNRPQTNQKGTGIKNDALFAADSSGVQADSYDEDGGSSTSGGMDDRTALNLLQYGKMPNGSGAFKIPKPGGLANSAKKLFQGGSDGLKEFIHGARPSADVEVSGSANEGIGDGEQAAGSGSRRRKVAAPKSMAKSSKFWDLIPSSLRNEERGRLAEADYAGDQYTRKTNVLDALASQYEAGEISREEYEFERAQAVKAAARARVRGLDRRDPRAETTEDFVRALASRTPEERAALIASLNREARGPRSSTGYQPEGRPTPPPSRYTESADYATPDDVDVGVRHEDSGAARVGGLDEAEAMDRIRNLRARVDALREAGLLDDVEERFSKATAPALGKKRVSVNIPKATDAMRSKLFPRPAAAPTPSAGGTGTGRKGSSAAAPTAPRVPTVPAAKAMPLEDFADRYHALLKADAQSAYYQQLTANMADPIGAGDRFTLNLRT